MAEHYVCVICGKPCAEYEPEFCCSGFECGCQGMPIEPCVCSERCWDAVFGGIGESFEDRRKKAGIPEWKEQEATNG